MRDRVAVLLGAGASVDAGLPLTGELAQMLVAMANAPEEPYRWRETPDWVRALNFVYGAMVGHQAEDGSNPLSAVNIERLISAIRLLKDFGAHEVAPFVAAWKPGVLGIGSPDVDRDLGRQLIDAMPDGSSGSRFFAESRVAEAVAAIARAATHSGGTTAFAEVEQHLLGGLARVLGTLNDVGYLAPIAALAREQQGGLDVLTLNYDLSVERMALEANVSVDRGIERWTPGRPFRFRRTAGTINLYKLHGSLDWMLDDASSEVAAPRIATGKTPSPEEFRYHKPRLPWIVVGDREKLATDGPTLALLRAAEDALAQARHLAVVGYSFSDGHVNAVIRNWLLADQKRTIAILDLQWGADRELNPFLSALWRVYGADLSARRRGRIAPIAGSAAGRLADVLRARPLPIPAQYASGAIKKLRSGVTEIRVTLLGPDVERANVSAQYLRPRSNPTPVTSGINSWATEEEALADNAPHQQSSYRTTSFIDWLNGQERAFYTRIPEGVSLHEVQVHFRRTDSRDSGVIRIDKASLISLGP
ncbi:MAG: SIR2 family protein [Glaciihabitans sp.]